MCFWIRANSVVLLANSDVLLAFVICAIGRVWVLGALFLMVDRWTNFEGMANYPYLHQFGVHNLTS